MRLIAELLILLLFFTVASLYKDCNSINEMLYTERENLIKDIDFLNSKNQRLEMTINDFSPIERNSTTTITQYRYLTQDCPIATSTDCEPFKSDSLYYQRRYDVMKDNYEDCYVELEQLQINCK